jgi:hypothetical protein
MPDEVATRRLKVVIAVGVLAALSLFVVALVTFIQEGEDGEVKQKNAITSK